MKTILGIHIILITIKSLWKNRRRTIMSMNDMEKMKKFLEDKKAKSGFLKSEKKIGSGKVEKNNKNIGTDCIRTKKISQ